MQPVINNNGRTILVGEDELEVRGYFEMVLKCLGFNVELAQDGDEVLSCLRALGTDIAAVLLDITMPNRNGLDTLREIRRINSTLPVIVVSGAPSTANIVTAMQHGATDFLGKPVFHEDLQKAIARSLETRVTDNTPSPRSVVAARTFIGSNPRIKEIHSLIGRIAWSEAPVLIQGETGSGKEVIARELHAQSPRGKKAFLKLNCAALPSELVESELFGYERGAFTGAFQKKAGMFEMADGGTILLDEIGDMDVRLQAKLLQVLQDQEFQRIGGKEPIKVDVRVIAATHRDLLQGVQDRTFREDLYYRLDVVNIQLPPLRERPEDILPLAEFLIRKHATSDVQFPSITVNLRRAMLSYDWPGNIRQLENFVRRLLILQTPEKLIAELEPEPSQQSPRPALVPDKPAMPRIPFPLPMNGSSTLEEVDRAKRNAEGGAILEALNATHWNRKRAARLLKLDYKALLYKMKKLGLDRGTTPLPAHSETGFEREIAMSAAEGD